MHPDELNLMGICSDQEWIPITLNPGDELDISEPVKVEIRHLIYSKAIQETFNSEEQFKIYGKLDPDDYDEVYEECKILFEELNFIYEFSIEKYGLELLICLREHERETKQVFQKCDQCLDENDHRARFNCFGDKDEILDLVFEFNETKNKIKTFYKNQMIDLRVKAIKQKNEIDKAQQEMLQKMIIYNRKAYTQNINYFPNTLYICPYRLIDPWMEKACQVMYDCLDSNFNIFQWPRGTGLLKEWNKTVLVFTIMKNKLIEIKNFQAQRKPIVHPKTKVKKK